MKFLKENPDPLGVQASGGLKEYTIEEVAKHNDKRLYDFKFKYKKNKLKLYRKLIIFLSILFLALIIILLLFLVFSFFKKKYHKNSINENYNKNMFSYDQIGEMIFYNFHNISFDKLDEYYYETKRDLSNFNHIHILFAFDNNYYLLSSVGITSILIKIVIFIFILLHLKGFNMIL